MDRLRSIAPDLVSRLSTASDAQRQRVALAVARWVTTRVESIPLEVIAGLDGVPPSSLNETVERLDDEYLSLQAKEEAGECSDDEVVAAFARARAASSLVYAIVGDPAESIYEAVVATEDLAGVRQIVLKSLDAAA